MIYAVPYLLYIQTDGIIKVPGGSVIYFPTFAIRDFGRPPDHYVRPHSYSVEDRRYGAENPPVLGIGKAKALSPGLVFYTGKNRHQCRSFRFHGYFFGRNL